MLIVKTISELTHKVSKVYFVEVVVPLRREAIRCEGSISAVRIYVHVQELVFLKHLRQIRLPNSRWTE
ncbi:MAG: hypothetical protein V3S72_08730 [Desulfobacterales bacterium]